MFTHFVSLHEPLGHNSIEYDIRLIGPVGRVFANGLGDLGSILGRVIPKIQKMVLDSVLPNTQQYKVRIKGKVEKSSERRSVLSVHL